MAITHTSRGFTLLIAVIFMSVMLAFGVALGSLAYKQTTLVSTVLDSQNAFYAADAALECALYYDQQVLVSQAPFFDYTTYANTSPGSITCGGQTASPTYTPSTGIFWKATYQIPIDTNQCADVTIYKYNGPQTVNGKSVTTFIFSQGYSVNCNSLLNPRLTARGEDIYY